MRDDDLRELDSAASYRAMAEAGRKPDREET
jgi:hypothetical protein